MSFTDGNLFIRKICQLCENPIPVRDGEWRGEKLKASISGETCAKKREERQRRRGRISRAKRKRAVARFDAPDGRSDGRSFTRASERANSVRMSLLINSHSDRQKGQPSADERIK